MASVLMVEDEADVAELLCELLVGYGHTVRHVTDARAALEVLDAGLRPDVVITDMILPGGLTGRDLARALRARMPDLPVVLASGHSEAFAEFRAAGLPMLRKPFRAAELEAAVRQALQGVRPA